MQTDTGKFPICRDLSKPWIAAILHLPLATHAFGNSLRNNRLLELFVFLNTGTGLGKDSINIGTFKI